jgi:hypothetical protein
MLLIFAFALFLDVGDDYAREKASQVLRDAVALLPANAVKSEAKSATSSMVSKHTGIVKRECEEEPQKRRVSDASDTALHPEDSWKCPTRPLKRQRTSNFFEWFPFGKSDSNRSLGTFPASPCLSRQGSLSASRKGSLGYAPIVEGPLLDWGGEFGNGTATDEFSTEFF